MAEPADVARFRRDLIALTREAPSRERPIAVAVSGGPDSMALLALAAAAFPDAVIAATVDHGLREAAAEEARMVAREAETLGVPHAVLTVAGPIAGASLQARARDARYALLADWAEQSRAMAVATAHHADDQAETFLMRASRGSGVSGLASIRATTVVAGAPVVRPLLAWRRAALRAIVRRAGLPFVNDPANSDPRHDRTRFRQLLDGNEWLDPPALARTAAAVAEAERDLVEIALLLWRERVEMTGDSVTLDPAGLPRDPLRRMVRRAIATVRAAHDIVSPAFDESANIEPLLDTLLAGRRATHGGVLASPRRGRWHFKVAPSRRSL
ncbi:tRNA(Ile)-lysidine synthase [Sphingomonas sp. OV641]|uniref:tRNA lysidine(34) synthetase TilS n=1 Tax=Sphingomonas sp. OV641 TaxID=1881068 RepID=UPI0008C435BF|nr:tRNA lysidine(34) synthetase TilS [Sphingomonas sp. OV641]SEJ79921.1 tRNA(Ile)-lysidine synthase [Sphingomonas sp. OV641]